MEKKSAGNGQRRTGQQNSRPSAGKRPADSQKGRPVPSSAGTKKKPARSTQIKTGAGERTGTRNVRGGKKSSAQRPEEATSAKLKLNRPAEPRPVGQDEADRRAMKALEQEKREKRRGAPVQKPLAPAKKPQSPYMRRLRRIVLAVVMMLVALTVCAVLCLTVFFKIEEITVEGKTRYDKEDIIASSMIESGDNFLLCNTAPAESAIKSKFSYIENVVISKKLFNKIIISVSEAKPSTEIESDGKYIVISKSGKILEINKKKKYDVPTVLGAKLKDVKLAAQIKYKDKNLKKYLDRIIKQLAECKLDDIVTIDLSDHSHVELVRKSGFRVIIGSFENLEYKISTAAAILSSSVKDTDQGTLDVSLASSEGGKSYLKIGAEVSKVSEKKKEKKKAESSIEESEKTADDGETAEPAEETGETTEETADPGEEYTDDGYTDDGGVEYTDDGYTDDGGEDYTDDGYTDDGGEDYTDDGYTDDGGENYTDDGYYDDGGEDYADEGYTDDGYYDGGEDY